MNDNERKIIYVCSPCRGNVAANVSWAKLYTELVLRSGHTPITPHAFYTEYLDDDNPQERALGLEAGISLLRRCDEVWIFGTTITDGMQAEIAIARTLDIPVRRAQLYSTLSPAVKCKRFPQPLKVVFVEVEQWKNGK